MPTTATNNTTVAAATTAGNNMDPMDSTAAIATTIVTTALKDRISLEDSNLVIQMLEELGIKIIIVGYYECS
jgi:hypothetical protein